MMCVGHDRGGEANFSFRQRGRIGDGRRDVRHRIVGRIESVGIDLAQIGDRGFRARVQLAVADPERRVTVSGIIGVEGRPFFLAADDAVELAVGEFAQLLGDRRIGIGDRAGRRRGRWRRCIFRGCGCGRADRRNVVAAGRGDRCRCRRLGDRGRRGVWGRLRWSRRGCRCFGRRRFSRLGRRRGRRRLVGRFGRCFGRLRLSRLGRRAVAAGWSAGSAGASAVRRGGRLLGLFLGRFACRSAAEESFISSGLTIATTASVGRLPSCGLRLCGRGWRLGAGFEGSAGLAERVDFAADGVLAAAGAVAVSAAVPNFGSAEAMLAVPARGEEWPRSKREIGQFGRPALQILL